MLEMYSGTINSPETTITNNINNTDTLIYVLDETKVPSELPNIMVLGTGTAAETIKVLSIKGQTLTVQRAFQGTAKIWNAGTIIARNFTEYDYKALKENVEELKTKSTSQNTEITAIKTKNTEQDTKISQLSNPNLLINGWFKINQRSLSVYLAAWGQYTFDRWSVESHSELEVRKNSDGTVTIKNLGAYNNAQFKQVVETIFAEGTELTGSVDVISYSGNVKIGIGNVVSPYDEKTLQITKTGINIINYSVSASRNTMYKMAIVVGIGSTVTIKCAKLELGEIATPFVPKSYREELRACQYYYWKPEGVAIGFAGYVYGNQIAITINKEVMRIKPRAIGIIAPLLIAEGTEILINHDGDIQIENIGDNLRIFFFTSQNVSQFNKKPVGIYLQGSLTPALDAEIY